MSEPGPIIIKRKKVVGGGGHHGGAWKVAYADFVTAMMAFFLLMWLLNATSEDQRRGLADYFDPSIPLSRNSAGGSGMMNGDKMLSPPETATSEETGDRDPKTRYRRAEETPEDARDAASREGRSDTRQAGPDDKPGEESEDTKTGGGHPGTAAAGADADGLDRIGEQLEREFAALGNEGLSRHFTLRMTPEGLVIEINDLYGEPLFDSGATDAKPILKTLIDVITPVLNLTTNDIAVVGHTDAAPYSGRSDYSNWELSVDRANIARRLLTDAGLPESRVVRVSGRAATDPIAQDAGDARNRRIAITLLRNPQHSDAGD